MKAHIMTNLGLSKLPGGQDWISSVDFNTAPIQWKTRDSTFHSHLTDGFGSIHINLNEINN